MEFIVVHRPKDGRIGRPLPCTLSIGDSPWIFWDTCRREIAIGLFQEPPTLDENLEFYDNERAYEFLLEVLTGLLSPVVGETEVLGQFHARFDRFIFPKTPWGQELRQLVQDLSRDAKSVRDEALKDLGSHSYGSLVRKLLRRQKIKSVYILGTGQLCESLLPWLHSEFECHVIGRRPERLLELRSLYPVQTTLWTETLTVDESAAVVVAAPITDEALCNLTAQQKLFLIDLREREQTPLLTAPTIAVVSLEDFFREMEDQKHELSRHIENARSIIRNLIAERRARSQLRPFGWDDLCAL